MYMVYSYIDFRHLDLCTFKTKLKLFYRYFKVLPKNRTFKLQFKTYIGECSNKIKLNDMQIENAGESKSS